MLCRGVARGLIVRDVQDRKALLHDLGELLSDTQASCLAWCLMDNHLHLVVRTGRKPLAWVMQRLLLRHAQRFNTRWRRVGHLFQNRYKALLVDEDTYLLALIRYVHRNPLVAGAASSLRALATYPWCGHGALLGTHQVPWQATKEVLGLFGRHQGEARRAYLAWMAETTPDAATSEIERIVRGRRRIMEDDDRPGRPATAEREADERILGEGQFVASALRSLEGTERRKTAGPVRWTPTEVVHRAAEAIGIDAKRLSMRDRRRPVTDARAIACSWLVDDLGMRGVDAARMLGVSPPAGILIRLA